MSETPLTPFSLTNVHYDPSDPISHICAWLALLPQGLCIVYVTLIYTTREIEIALTFCGQLVCEGLNWGLKRLIKEDRPQAIRHLGKGYGMPSSHSQFVGFFAVYVSLFLMWRHSPSSRRWVASSLPRLGESKDSESTSTYENKHENKDDSSAVAEYASIHEDGGDTSPAPPSPPLRSALAHAHSTQVPFSPAYTLQLHHPRLTHTLLTLAAMALALAVCASRIYLQYHTPRQVAVGLLIGAAFAVLWFCITEWARRRGWVEWVLELTIVRRARVRDLVCTEDLVELGFQVWEEKRRQHLLAQERKRRKSVTFKAGVEVVRASPGGTSARKKKR